MWRILPGVESRSVGSLSVSVLGLGVGNVTDANRDRVAQVVHAALDSGITYFDISNRPDSTERHLAAIVGRHRDRVVIGTKFGSRPRPGVLADASPGHVRESVERSLRNLGTDRIDLLFLHRPDPATPIADTLGALDELVRAGKVRQIGCSKFTAAQLRAARGASAPGSARFTGIENPCNLLDAGDVGTVLPVCEELGVAYLAYWPLAAGLLTGKYSADGPPPPDSRFATNAKWVPRRGEWHTARNFETITRLTDFAAARDRTLVELAFGWLRGLPAVATMIAGASSAAQVRANAAAATSWTLTGEEHGHVTALTGASSP
jgi:aryl-alcohol dehydrogenase-like predicted oxidoreductase